MKERIAPGKDTIPLGGKVAGVMILLQKRSARKLMVDQRGKGRVDIPQSGVVTLKAEVEVIVDDRV